MVHLLNSVSSVHVDHLKMLPKAVKDSSSSRSLRHHFRVAQNILGHQDHSKGHPKPRKIIQPHLLKSPNRLNHKVRLVVISS